MSMGIDNRVLDPAYIGSIKALREVPMTRSSWILGFLLVGAAFLQLAAEDGPPQAVPSPGTGGPFLLEIQQVEVTTRGVGFRKERILFTLQTLVVPGSPIHLRAIQKGQAIHLDGSLGPEEKDGLLLKLTGCSVEEMESPPPDIKGPAFDMKKFELEKRTVPGQQELIGEVKDTNNVYRLTTYATLKKPGPGAEIIEALRKHAK